MVLHKICNLRELNSRSRTFIIIIILLLSLLFLLLLLLLLLLLQKDPLYICNIFIHTIDTVENHYVMHYSTTL